MYEVTRLL